jgi:DEAD/DEAH box helicase domain-containing protein
LYNLIFFFFKGNYDNVGPVYGSRSSGMDAEIPLNERIASDSFSMDINEYIASLKSSRRLGNQVVFHQILPESPPVYGVPLKKWSREVRAALANEGISRLYEHQTRAIDLIRQGKHTVVATPTASGKSLIYNLPVMESILENPLSRALYLFPLKALAQDQVQKFRALSAGAGPVSSTAAIYDGDTTSWFMKKIRETTPLVIMTNPEMLHLSFLPHHLKWRDFLSGLKFVVVDEVHTYRGVMGSHMAQVFRRLNRITARYGAFPVYIFCSATISNPSQLSEQLTGLDVKEITLSGAPRGKRHLVFMDPVDGAAQMAIQLLKAALHRGLRTIVYAQSRKMTELIATWSQNRSGEFSGKISAYRAGFLPEERREIESRLNSGELLAVITTSALELGIDIGDLDLCILVGYPGTIVSTFQRGGRVGRSGQDSALVLIAGEDALDQYFMRHPLEILSREPEAAVINPYNPHILSRHLTCAAAEIPLEQGEPFLLPPPVKRALADLEEKGLLLQSARGGQWHPGRRSPHREVDLRGSGNPYVIIDRISGNVIGEIDEFRAFKETHPGAVYLHMGETWLVRNLDIVSRTARAIPTKVNYYTRVTSHKDTEILEVYEEKTIGDTLVRTGRLKVVDQVTGYEKWAIYTKTKLNRVELDLPPLIFETDGLWFVIPVEIQKEAEVRYLHFMGGIHALEHAAIGIFPLLVLTDRNDLGGISTPHHAQSGGPAVFIYDGVAGGAGLSRQAFFKAESLLQYTFNAIKDCPCETGCPSCVHSPKCGSGNRPIDKASALFILQEMIRPNGKITRTDSLKYPEVFSQAKRSPKNIRLKRKRRVRISPETEAVISTGAPEAAADFCVLDIETQRSAEEVGGWNRADLMKVSCAVLYDGTRDVYLEYLEHQISDLLNDLNQFHTVVGFNIKRFDYRVLSGYTDFDFSGLNTVDILEDVHQRLGYRLSLDHLSKATLGAEKTADGLMALKWWKEGKIRNIIDYCKVDVQITKNLFLFGKINGYLLFTNKAKQMVRLPVNW